MGRGDVLPVGLRHRPARPLGADRRAERPPGRTLAGERIRANLESLLRTDTYRKAYDPQKVKLIAGVVTSSQKIATNEVLGPETQATPTPRSGAPARVPTPTSRAVDPERRAGARRAAETRRRNATATAQARR